jgi:hypothetical protein
MKVLSKEEMAIDFGTFCKQHHLNRGDFPNGWYDILGPNYTPGIEHVYSKYVEWHKKYFTKLRVHLSGLENENA